MSNLQTLSAIFVPEPDPWGLRGDPYLWREMAGILGDRPLPESEEQLTRLIETAFELLTGASIGSREPVYVPRHAHGGMSSGHISPEFWRETALPLLRSRLRALSSGG